MLEYQSVVMEGFISQEFSSVSADSKIVMGFIKMAMNNYHAVKHRYDEIETGIMLYNNLNSNSKRYARLDSRKYDVYLITDAVSINIEDADEKVYNGSKIDGIFLGYDVFIREENTLCACIRLDGSGEYSIEGCMQNWPDIAIDKSIDSVRKILTSDRSKLIYDIEEAIMATIILMKYCIIDVYKSADSISKDNMLRCIALANEVTKLVKKCQEEVKITDSIGHYNMEETINTLTYMTKIIRPRIL